MKLILSGCMGLCVVLLLNSFREETSSKVSHDYLYNDQIDTTKYPNHFGFGRTATAEEIRAWDIDIRPDGQGLPPGVGKVEPGKNIYNIKCLACHGVGGIGGPHGSLAISPDSTGKRREKVIGNYWSHATTIFDYVRRAMPFVQPGSLTDEEVYHVTAYLLYINHIINANDTINQETLPKIEMPAFKLYVPDDRRGGAEIR